MNNTHSVNIEGKEIPLLSDIFIYDGWSFEQQKEVIFRLFGFSKIRTDGQPAFKSEQASPLFEDYKSDCKINYELFANGSYTIEQVTDIEEVRELLRQGLNDYRKSTGQKQVNISVAENNPIEPVQPTDIQKRFQEVKNKIITSTGKAKQEAIKEKQELVNQVREEFFKTSNFNIDDTKKEIINKVSEKHKVAFTPEQADKIDGIIASSFSDDFINMIIWNIGIANDKTEVDSIIETETNNLIKNTVSKVLKYLASVKNENNENEVIFMEEIKNKDVKPAEEANYVKPQVVNPVKFGSNHNQNQKQDTPNPRFQIVNTPIDWNWANQLVDWNSMPQNIPDNFKPILSEKIAMGLQSPDIINAINVMGNTFGSVMFYIGDVHGMNDFYIYAPTPTGKNVTLHYMVDYVEQV